MSRRETNMLPALITYASALRRRIRAAARPRISPTAGRILPILLFLISLTAASAAPRSWDIARIDSAPEARVVVRQADVEVRAARGVIYFFTNRPTQVKVYSILGQLVAQSSLQSGTYRMTLANHGVYLIKIGDLTCKVAI